LQEVTVALLKITPQIWCDVVAEVIASVASTIADADRNLKPFDTPYCMLVAFLQF
jgi:hypothetical protein